MSWNYKLPHFKLCQKFAANHWVSEMSPIPTSFSVTYQPSRTSSRPRAILSELVSLLQLAVYSFTRSQSYFPDYKARILEPCSPSRTFQVIRGIHPWPHENEMGLSPLRQQNHHSKASCGSRISSSWEMGSTLSIDWNYWKSGYLREIRSEIWRGWQAWRTSRIQTEQETCIELHLDVTIWVHWRYGYITWTIRLDWFSDLYLLRRYLLEEAKIEGRWVQSSRCDAVIVWGDIPHCCACYSSRWSTLQTNSSDYQQHFSSDDTFISKT